MKNIFVGNLSFGATEETLRSTFESYGTVERASIVSDRETGHSRGFAFVEMPNDEEGERAIAALNGKELNGRALTINEARPKAEGGSRGGGGGRDRGSGGGGGGRRQRY